MEGNDTEFLDENFLEGEELTKGLPLSEKLNELISEKMPKKSIEELRNDEEKLNSFLNKIKKQNFQLQITLNAWRTTLKNKLEEIKEADLKLDEIHNEIQSEREEFCSRIDKFNERYGIHSYWWEEQMNFLSEEEKLEEKNSQQEKCKEEIKKLEKDIEEIKEQIEALKTEKQVEIEVNLTQGRESSIRSNDGSSRKTNTKKIKIAEENMTACEEKGSELSENFYSLVDVEKVRMACKRMNRRRPFFA